MITKFSKVEEILEIKLASERLPFDLEATPGDGLSKFASLNNVEESEDGYLYVRCRAISSRVNKNNDGWPSDQLAASYKSFIGRPIFVDHNNDDPSRARGVIVDSRLHVEDDEKTSSFDPYYATAPDNHRPPTWIELLLEVDAKTFPKLATAVRKGHIDAVSMGANIETSVCSVCDHRAKSPIEYCSHVQSKGAEFEITSATGEKMMKKAYEDCHDITFFEISFVFDPADPTALISEKSDNKLAKVASEEVLKESKNCKCWDGYERVPGTEPCEPGSCKKCDERIHDKKKTSKQELKTILTAKEFLTSEEVTEVDAYPHEIVQEMLQALSQNKGKRSFSYWRKKALSETQLTDGNEERELNYVPQSEMVSSPAEVVTIKVENQCPNCHSDVLIPDSQGTPKCPSCSWVQEPHPLDSPDLSLHLDLVKDEQSPELEEIEDDEPNVTFFSTKSKTIINVMEWTVVSNKIIVDKTSAILPKKIVLNPSSVTKTEDPQNAKIISDQKQPVTSSKDKVDNMENEKNEKKLLAAFSLADEFVNLGLIEDEQKLAFVATLEDETNEALEARKATISLVKEAGLSKPVAKVAGLSRVPKLAGYSNAVSSNDLDDIPFEAAFM